VDEEIAEQGVLAVSGEEESVGATKIQQLLINVITEIMERQALMQEQNQMFPTPATTAIRANASNTCKSTRNPRRKRSTDGTSESSMPEDRSMEESSTGGKIKWIRFRILEGLRRRM